MKTANTAKIVPVVADNTAWTFTATTATLNGHEFAAEYSLAQTGDVYVFAIVQGIPVRIHVGKASPVYHACFEAAMAAKSQPKAEAKPAAEPAKPVETKPAEQPKAEAKPAAKRKAPAKAAKQPAAEKPAAEPAKPVEAKPADQPKAEAKPAAKRKAPAKAAKQPATEKPAAEPAKPVDVASKSWIGTTVEGKGWRIAFDEATQRTRVIFDADPSAKQKAAIDAAGFYWSNTTKSWNKKLTCKAYRAAMALHETLYALA